MISSSYLKSETTVVIFSGLAHQNHMFEWIKSFENFNINTIAVSDPFKKWYQEGIDETREDILDSLKNMRKTNKLICIGGSAGGFGALMFGKELSADKIIAFSPQSACGEKKRDLGDNRWLNFCLFTPSFDLKGNYSQAVIYFSLDDELDSMHARRIKSNRYKIYENGGHNLPKVLKTNGQLIDILREELEL